MTTIVTREVGATAKGSPLTNAEVDNNFINLNTNKVEVADFNPLARPSVKPSLLLDFANTKQLDSRITFTRASTATYWDGKTFAKAEENLLRRSQEFDSAAWSKVGCSISANAQTAPDGTATADTLSGTAGGYSQYISLTSPAASVISADSSKTTTFSIYLKAGTISSVRFYIFNTTGGASIYGTFNLTALSASPGGSAMTPTVSISDAGNGWRRCVVTGHLGGSSGHVANVAIYADNGSFHIWGAQAEQRSFATAYTPTTDQPITKYQPVMQTAAANAPRFDHNPVTGESLGLLVEEQRTNLLTYSGNLSAANLSAGSRAANALVAPDGSLSASIINGTGGAAASTWTQSATATAATMTFSCHLKTGLPSSVASFLFLMRNTTTGKDFSIGSFNQVTGAIIGTGWSSAHVGNGWYRISYTNQESEVITVGNVITCYLGATGGIIYPTSAALCVWGIQLEAGAFPTSYIPTTTAQVTRTADDASMTGTNFSSWYRQDEGTFVSEVAPSSMSAVNICVMAATDGTDINVIGCFADAGYGLYVYRGSAIQAAIAGGTYSAGAFSKNASSYSLNSFATCLNSGAVAVDSNGLVPTLSQLWIGRFTNNYRLNGRIKRIAYYPNRLTNTELQALTA